MATILESLKGVNAYPVPLRTLVETAERRGLKLTDEATREAMGKADYNLAVADILLWLAFAPNITQGGQSFSFTDEQRQQFRQRANALYEAFGTDEEIDAHKPSYGYKGSRL